MKKKRSLAESQKFAMALGMIQGLVFLRCKKCDFECAVPKKWAQRGVYAVCSFHRADEME